MGRVFVAFAIVSSLILSSMLTLFHSSTGHAVYNTWIGPSVTERASTEDNGYTQRVTTLRMYVMRSDVVMVGVPISALHMGLDIRTTGRFTISTTVATGQIFNTTTVVSNMVRAEMGVTIGEQFNNLNARFIQEHNHTLSQSWTRYINSATTTTQEHNITDPSQFGFYTLTMYTFYARRHTVRLYRTESTRHYQGKGSWSGWHSATTPHNYFVYVPLVQSGTFINFRVWANSTEYFNYMRRFNASVSPPV